jgi:hypothetical protein
MHALMMALWHAYALATSRKQRKRITKKPRTRRHVVRKPQPPACRR